MSVNCPFMPFKPTSVGFFFLTDLLKLLMSERNQWFGVIWEAPHVFFFSLAMSCVSWGRDNGLAVDRALSFYCFISHYDLFFGLAICHWLTKVLWVSPNFRNSVSENTWNFSHPASQKTPWSSEKKERGGSSEGLGRSIGQMGGWWN